MPLGLRRQAGVAITLAPVGPNPDRRRIFFNIFDPSKRARYLTEMVIIARDIDVPMLDYILTLSYEQRLLNHQGALDLLEQVLKARKELYGESKQPPKATPPESN